MILSKKRPPVKALFASSIVASLLLSSTTGMCAAPLAPLAIPKGPATNIYGGYNYASPQNFGFGGVTYSVDHDLNKSGFLVDFNNFIGTYRFNSLNSGIEIASKGSFQGGMLSGGYHLVTPKYSVFNLLLGVELLNFQMENSTNQCTAGTFSDRETCQYNILQALGLFNPKETDYGFQISGNAYIPLSEKTYVYASGLYAVVWDTYTVLGKFGYWLTPKLSVGPQVSRLSFSVLGKNTISGVSPAATASYFFASNFSVNASAGYYIDTSSKNVSPNSGFAGSLAFAYNY